MVDMTYKGQVVNQSFNSNSTAKKLDIKDIFGRTQKKTILNHLRRGF